MTQVRPAVVATVPVRRFRIAVAVVGGVAGLGALVALGVLVVDLATGADGRRQWRGSDVPLWLLMAIAVVVWGSTAWQLLARRRLTGPKHGLLDMAVVDGALRISRLRPFLRPYRVVVRPGETVTLRARVERTDRRGASLFWFTVKAPGGSFTFTDSVVVESFSLAPLDDAARELGIEVEVSGEATAMQRGAGIA